MSLQHREDVDRLIVEGDYLANECCCECDGTCHRFDACCDAATYEELLDYPHYIVITDAKYTALGDPDCVVYNGCCYCDHIETEKAPTVDPADVTASAETTCDDCNGSEGDECVVCNFCNACDPKLLRKYTATFDVELGPLYTDPGSGFTPAQQAQLQAAYDTPWVLDYTTTECFWIWTDRDTDFFDQFTGLLGGVAANTLTTGTGTSATNDFTQATFDGCDPTGLYDYNYIVPATDDYFLTGGSCIIS